MKDYREHLQREKDHARLRLVDQARSLSRRLEQIATSCEKQDDPIINELGEIQGSAPMFDAACGRYGEVRQMLRDYDSLAAASSEEQQ